jgi:cyclopropane fatty-acyl-phospholipid synthase-like methyltransferase
MTGSTNRQLDRVRTAYDLTVDQYRRGVDPYAEVPDPFRNSPEFKAFMENTGRSCGSGAPENKAYLDPKPGMRFLDAGCCANLHVHRLDRWPSTYFGLDISPALIAAMRGVAERLRLPVGGLYVAEVADLPFDDDFFDIADVVGVLEYCSLEYTGRALHEFYRVLKPMAKMVVDIPNLAHSHVQTMFRLERHLGRPNIPKSRAAFEEVLTPLFSIERVYDSHVMLKYFVRTVNTRTRYERNRPDTT